MGGNGGGTNGGGGDGGGEIGIGGGIKGSGGGGLGGDGGGGGGGKGGVMARGSCVTAMSFCEIPRDEAAFATRLPSSIPPSMMRVASARVPRCVTVMVASIWPAATELLKSAAF